MAVKLGREVFQHVLKVVKSLQEALKADGVDGTDNRTSKGLSFARRRGLHRPHLPLSICRAFRLSRAPVFRSKSGRPC